MKDIAEFGNALKERLLNKELFIKNAINKLLMILNKIRSDEISLFVDKIKSSSTMDVEKEHNNQNSSDSHIIIENNLKLDELQENIKSSREFEEFKVNLIDLIYQMKDDLDQYLIQCYKLENLLESSERELKRIELDEKTLDYHIENNKKILQELTDKYEEDLKLKKEIYEIDLIQKNLNSYKTIEDLESELTNLEKELIEKDDVILMISKEMEEKKSFIEIKRYLDSRIKSYDF